MKIKNIEFKNNLILAPMSNITDVAFRSIAIDCGADAGSTELISAKALTYNNQKTLDMLFTADNENIKIVQLFGKEPDVMAEACKSDYLKKFDIIDINMGCPAPKIIKNGEGSALLKNIRLAEEIIRACVNATNKPITVKFRSGWDNDSIVAVEFARMCERAGASAITIHARTAEQGYSGTADWDIIKQVKESVNIPVIGNGDVVDRASYLKMLEYTKVDAVMVGRGAMGQPYIFSELLGEEDKHNPLHYIKKHIEILKNFYHERFIIKHMRKHILWYLKNIRNANKLKAEIVMEKDLNVVLSKLEELFG